MTVMMDRRFFYSGGVEKSNALCWERGRPVRIERAARKLVNKKLSRIALALHHKRESESEISFAALYLPSYLIVLKT
jgi:hypothetical protein